MNKIKSSYDVIVLGDSIGALVAATTAANDRAETLWIPHERRTWSVHSGGYNFPVEEGLVTGMAPGGAFTLLCEGTGIHPSEAMKFAPVSPALQIITPQMRLALPRHKKDLLHELQLELGESAARESEEFLERVDVLRREVDTWISHLVRADDDDIPPPPEKTAGATPAPLADAMHALLVSVTHTINPDALAPFERSRALGVFRAGIFAPHMAMGRDDDAEADKRKRVSSGAALAVRHMLASRARHTPMTIARGIRVESIRTRFGTARGVLLNDGTRIDSKTVITALASDDEVKLDGWMARRKTASRVRGVARTFTVHLIAGSKVFPVGMGPRVVLVRDPTAPMLGPNHIVVSRDKIDEEIERVALTVRIPIGASVETRKKTLLESISHLREITPFLDDDLRGIFPPLGTSKDLKPDSKQTDPWTIARGPVALDQMPAGEFPGARFQTPVKNLLTTGAATLPGLGYEGELISGVAAGRRALRIVHKS